MLLIFSLTLWNACFVVKHFKPNALNQIIDCLSGVWCWWSESHWGSFTATSDEFMIIQAIMGNCGSRNAAVYVHTTTVFKIHKSKPGLLVAIYLTQTVCVHISVFVCTFLVVKPWFCPMCFHMWHKLAFWSLGAASYIALLYFFRTHLHHMNDAHN